MERKDTPLKDRQTKNETILAVVVDKIYLLGEKNPVVRIATPLVLLAFILLAAMAIRNIAEDLQNSRQADLQTKAVALAAPTLGIADGAFLEAKMPSYTLPDLLPFSGIPRLANPQTRIPDRTRGDVLLYEVEQGDNVFAIAEKFDLQPETILWGNYLALNEDPRYLNPGDQLNILPIDGVYRQYNSGESLIDIAESLNTTVEAILEWPGNRLDPYETDPAKPQIADGRWLIIPGGSREVRDWGPPIITRQDPTVAAYYGEGSCGTITEGPVGNGFFVWPTTQTTLSGFDWNPPLHNGIDIGGAQGDAIYAADSGVVVYAGSSAYGFGLLIVIDHGDGLQTAYAHLSGIEVSCGQGVSQGQQIGNLGNTGNSTGPHLHFEITINGAKVNPWSYVSP